MIGERMGAWVIVGQIGEGTQGTVYAARHLQLDREAAIKVLHPNLARDRGRIDRFFDEARAASSIRHHSVIEIFDCGRETNHIFIAMERLVGETLYARLRRAPVTQGQAVTILRQIAEALAAAHAHGVVHRDLKPDNVFLAESDGAIVVKLLDFGIAKLAGDQRAGGTLTGAGALGTPPYMSPEQCDGAPVDHRADLYALGCLLHELVTGIPPFGFDHTMELFAAHRGCPAPALSDGCPEIPSALDELAARLLAKAPADRPASAGEVLDVLDGLNLCEPLDTTRGSTDSPISPTVIGPVRGWRARTWRAWIATSPWVAAAACCAVGAIMLGLAIIAGVGDSYGASNWGFTFIVLVPLIVSFFIKMSSRADTAVRDLASRGMLQTRSGIQPEALIGAAAMRLGEGVVGFGAFIALTSVTVSIAEWHHRWRNVPIVGAWWSESAFMGVVAAICQGGLIAIVLSFAVYCIGWGHLLHQLVTPQSAVRLSVDATSTDPRRGFELLEQPMALALITAALVQVALYASNVQHFAEIRGDSFFATLVPGSYRGLLDVGTGRYPSSTTLLASVLVTSFLLTAGFFVLRATRDAEGETAAWPLAMRPLRLAAILVVMSLVTVFYRLAPVAIVIALIVAGTRRRGVAS